MDVGVHSYSPRMQEAETRRVSNRLRSGSEANISCSIGSRPQLKKTKQEEGERGGGTEELPERVNDLLALDLFTSHKAAR